MNTHAPLFISIEQPFLTDEDCKLLAHPFVGGVVLFSRNFTSHSQIQDLVAKIKGLKTPALVVTVDHEGGRVQRFRQEFTVLPSMQKIGQLYAQDPDAALACARACGQIIGIELGAVGIDFSFTPVLDLDYGTSSVIGDRSFHASPAIVTALAGALVDGLAQTGMQAIGKHFPGHGFVSKDSHLELPSDPRPLAELWANDLQPFQALHPKLAGLMTAHVLYEAVDPHIATFSSYWLKQVLRAQLGYKGLIFSDDLMMHATQSVGNVVARAKVALNAGCDILLLCNDQAGVLKLLADDELIHSAPELNYTPLYVKPIADEKLWQSAIDLLKLHIGLH